MRVFRAGVFVVAAVFFASGLCLAQQQPAREGETFQDLRQDISALNVLNYINPTVEQMQKIAGVLRQWRKVAEAPPPQELLDALAKARQLMIKGLSRYEAESQSGLRPLLDNYARKLMDARNKATEAIVALLSDQQKQALAMLRTPYEYFQQLVWQIGASRAMDDERWQKWAEEMARRLSTSRRGQPLMSASEAQQFLQRVRGMNDQQWAQQAAALYQKMVSRLPQRYRQSLDNPRAVRQRIRRNLAPLLDNPRAPQLVQECIKADQAAGDK